MSLLAFAGAEDGLPEVTTIGTVTQSNTYARTGTYSYRMAHCSSGLGNGVALFFAGSNPIYFQFAYYLESWGTAYSDQKVIAFRKGGTILLSIAWTVNTALEVYRGDLATLIGSAGAGFTVGGWSVFEGYLYIHDTNGAFTLKKDNITICELTGINTKPGADETIDNMLVGVPAIYYLSGNAAFVDDLIVCDTNGSVMNSWVGGLRVAKLVPDGAGNYGQWTPSAGNNWECLDETPPSMTDKVTGTTGQKDTYTMTACPADCKAVKAVAARFWGEGGGQIKSLLRIGGTDYLGSNTLTVPAGFSKVEDIRYNSPATAGAFTPTELDGLESGMESQSG